MRNLLLTLLLCAAGGLAGPADAASHETDGKPPVVLELFTSQGCSSCPRADALFEAYTRRSDVIALSFSVDYWDYLGWKDTLASPKFTQRQRTYAKARGDGQIYTPQMIVNGVEHLSANRQGDVDKAIAEAAKVSAKGVPVSVELRDGQLHIGAGAAPAGRAKDATLWLVTLTRRVDVQVKRGENSGKTLAYFNVVREMTPIGMWSGAPLSVRLDKQTVAGGDAQTCAVILQAGHGGPILGAAMLPNW
jgi:hypothetical protein